MAVALWSRLTTGIFGRGAVSFLVATAGVNVSNFLFHIVVSRLLGPAHYGAVGSILSIVSLMAVPVGAAQLAVTQAVIGHTTNGQSFSLSRLIWRAFLVGFFAMLVFAALTPTIDGFLHISSPLPLYLVGAWIPLATVGAVLQGALIGEYRFRAVAFAAFVGGGPIRLLFGAGMVLAGFGVTGAIVATIFAQAFSTGSLLFSARQKVRSQPQVSVVRTTRRDMTLSIASIGSYTALIGVDTFLARHFFSATVAGQYAAGAIAAHIALFVPGAIVAVAFPHWVSGEGTSVSSRKAFTQALKFTVLLGILAAGALTVLSSFVVQVLFGSSYTGAIAIVGLLAFASAVIGILSLFIYFHLARRSLVALTPWLGVALAIVLISLRHQTMTSVATIMLVVSLLTLLVTSIPALLALAAAGARDAADDVSLIELPPVELDFTLVVPFYNPGSRFGKHIGEIVDVLSSSEISYEILAVSDGSTDHSEEQLAALSSEQLTLVRLEENQGKGAALRAGLSKGRGEYLGFIDGDGDLPANLLSNLLEIIDREHPDIIFGSKRHPRSEVVYPPLRRMYSWGYQQLNRALFHLPVRDTQTGVKVVRRDVLAAVLPRMVEKHFAFDLELFVVARQQGFRNFVEMPVSIGQRFSSTVSLRSVRNMLLDTFAIFYRLRVLRFYERDIRGKPEESLLTRPAAAAQIPSTEDATPGVQTGHERRLRILILNWRDITHPQAGGAEVYTHSVASEWVKEGHSVTLFCAVVDGRPATEDFDGLHIIRRGTRHGVYREAKRFYRREGRGNFDLVVDEVNTRPFGAPKWVDDVPVIALIHQVCREIWYYQTPLPVAFVGRYLLEPLWLRGYRDVLTVTLSESSKDSLEDYGLTRVVVVPVGFRSAGERPDVPRETRPTIAFVGRLSANKRPEEAIQAFEILRKTMPTAVLWVIGSGPMEDELRMSAPEGVQFLGKISESEKIERIARAHVLIVTSVREGWGLVVTEAAAVGTPVIAYDVAGLRDSVRASNGVLSAPDPKELSSVLQEFLSTWIRDGLPDISPGGVIPWSEVANRVLAVATSENPDLGHERDSVNSGGAAQPSGSV
jgi:glycosyltransferase involved in cell wall biosynthesis/O-antigen/teichoic acid export membrane protein